MNQVRPDATLGCAPVREPVAVVGIGCRFPGGVDGPRGLWSLLMSGADGVGTVPAARWDGDRFFHPDPSSPGRMYTRAGGFVDGIDLFDAQFFGVAAREASRMDPQQRLLLRTSWEAFEDAGLVPSRLAGSDTAVFVGVSSFDYGVVQLSDPESINAYTNQGSSASITANRLSYFFDFHGPSMSVDTACSSSLSAVHLACRAIWEGDAHLALAAGVSAMVVPGPSIGASKASMLSPTGRSRTFDATADGYARSEGVGAVVLKPLSAARADGDPVYCVILATAVNSDGHTPGITQPNGRAQEALLRRVYDLARVAPADVYYVEAHGTGTDVGDPVECGSIGRVLGRDREEPLRIGSLKSNIGHTEATAGVAGLIKVALALRNGCLPANLHFTTPNPAIPFDEMHLRVVTSPEPLPRRSRPVVMGVNAFGFGGSNAHAVVAEPPAAAEPSPGVSDGGPRLLLISARSPQALGALAASYGEFLRSDGVPALDDICHTAARRRSHHRYRLAAVGDDAGGLAGLLTGFATGDRPRGVFAGEAVDGIGPVFAFSGNGCQWSGMGRELLETEPVFRAAVDEIDHAFQPRSGWSIVAELAGGSPRVARTEFAQPGLFAVQMGLVALLRSWGVEPSAVLGHSVGEVAAACAAGALSVEQAAWVVHERSRLQERTAGQGRMAAVGLGETEAAAAIEDRSRLVIAAVNSPQAVTVAGDADELESWGRTLQERGVFFRLLPLDYAFHSPAMDPLREPLLDALSGLRPGRAITPFLSAVTGGETDGPTLNARYWWDNIRQPVRFDRAVQAAVERGRNLVIEIGAHPVLATYIGQCESAQPIHVVPTLRREAPERAAMLLALGACQVHGLPCRLDAAVPPGRHVDLPRYTWQEERHWNGPTDDGPVRNLRGRFEHPLLGVRLPAAFDVWESRVGPGNLRYLSDHVVRGSPLFPAAGYLEMGVAAARLRDDGPWEMTALQIRKPMVLDAEREVQVAVTGDDARLTVVSRLARSGEPWTEYATARLVPFAASRQPECQPLTQVRGRCRRTVSPAEHYARINAWELEYGPAFQAIDSLWVGDGEALVKLRLPQEAGANSAAYVFHPVLIDNCIQCCYELVAEGLGLKDPFLPARADRVRAWDCDRPVTYGYMRLAHRSEHDVALDLRLLSADGDVLLEVAGLHLDRSERRPGATGFYAFEWTPEVGGRPVDGAVMPSASAVAAGIGPADDVGPDAGQRARDFEDRSDALCSAYAARALTGLSGGRSFSIQGLLRERGLQPQHARLASRLADMLVEDHILSPDPGGGRWLWTNRPASPDPEPLWRELCRDYPALHADLLLLGRCGLHLEEVLSGRMDALTLIFPERGTGTIEHFYESAPTLGYGNAVMQRAISRIARSLPDGRPIRVLEIGAGTGGTTAWLLPVLASSPGEYTFTDVSDAFLMRAQSRFAQYPFVRYGKLDVERPQDSEFAGERFDVVVATNVLHATIDLRTTLRNVHELLAPNGLLLLAELHRMRLLDLVFGQLSGWWRFADSDLRSDSPLLTASEWVTVLRQVGYPEVAVAAEGTPMPGSQESLLIAAAGPGQAAAGESRQGLAVVQQPADGADAVPAAEGDEVWLLHGGRLGQYSGWGDLAAEVGAKLRRPGRRLVVIRTGEAVRRPSADQFVVRPDCPEDLDAVLSALAADGLGIHAVVYLAAAEDPLDDSWDADSLVRYERDVCLAATQWVQAVARHGTKPVLWLATRGVHPGAGEPANAAQAPIWGFGRVLMNEQPELRCRLVDVSPDLDVRSAAGLLAAEFSLQDASQEDEVHLTGHGRFVHRLHRLPDEDPPQGDGDTAASQVFCVQQRRHGLLDTLRMGPSRRRPPGPGDIEISVRAAGLNFHDVMWATGLLDPEAVEGGFFGTGLGMECAGRVIAVGPGVSRFRVGDEVAALAASAFASSVTTPARAAFHRPAHMSAEEGATLPLAFLTTHYALNHLARLQAGERLLVHGAAGGVGLAALQVATQAGAEVFATAGTPEKREFLRLMGVEHVMDSRSLAFADEVMEQTSGEGVDVVLNSLSGDAARKSLALLRPCGRFLEIGKRDVFEDRPFGLRALRHNVSYFVVDVDRLLSDQPGLCETLVHDMESACADGRFAALPFRLFPASRSIEAFRSMHQSRHIGKIVLSLREPATPIPGERPDQLHLDPDGTYVVSGGLGGFGLALGRWLVTRGARHLVLFGRSGAERPEATVALRELEAAGVAVMAAAADVADEGEVARLLERARAEMPALRGVFHAAMVLDDEVVANLDSGRWKRVLDPKVAGAWNLHRLTRNDPLGHFVCFSSLCTVIGNPRQANYSAANAFLDALAEYRRSRGLPGLSVGWGAIGDVGYVARNTGAAAWMQARVGARAMASADALGALEGLMLGGRTAVAAADMDWNLWGQGAPNAAAPKYHPVFGDRAESPGHSATQVPFHEIFRSCPPDGRSDTVLRRLAEHAGKVLGTAPDGIRPAASLTSQGLDSLMSAELQEAIVRDMGVEIPPMRLLQGDSLEAVARYVMERLAPALPPAAAEVGSAASRDRAGAGAQPLIVRLTDRPDPAVRLLAVPYLAAGAALFERWPQALPPEVELLALNLPGRPGRAAESPYESMANLLDAAVGALRPYADRPLVLYGHSFGAVMAYEIGLRLRAEGLQAPRHLIAASMSAPQDLRAFRSCVGLRVEDAGAAGSPSDWLQRLGGVVAPTPPADPGLRERLRTLLEAEVRMVLGYTCDAERRLDCPITCLCGRDDPVIRPETLSGWAERTTGPWRQVLLAGGHLLLHTHMAEALAVVHDVLASVVKEARAATDPPVEVRRAG